MSGSLTDGLSGAVGSLLGWRAALLPGSYKGVPFFLIASRGGGGRRLVTHEYPQRETWVVEDLGVKAETFRLQVFVAGPDYMATRDALIAACQGDDAAGILVHPTLGVLTCRAGVIDWSENPSEQGGYCLFDIEFHQEGESADQFGEGDTIAQALAGIASMAKLAINAYTTVSAIVRNPALLLDFATGLLGGAASSLLGIPLASGLGIALAARAIASSVTDDRATATAVTGVFQTAAAGVIARNAQAPAAADVVAGTLSRLAPAADLTGGLAALTAWGDTLPAPGGAGAVHGVLAAQQAAIVALVEGAATLAVLTIYAKTDFPHAAAAAAARTAALAMLDRQAAAANLAGQDDLYRGWTALTGKTMRDMIGRAQSLPSLIAWHENDTLPSLVLAQKYYQTAARADELAALNNVPHPLFMPRDGVRLSA